MKITIDSEKLNGKKVLGTLYLTLGMICIMIAGFLILRSFFTGDISDFVKSVVIMLAGLSISVIGQGFLNTEAILDEVADMLDVAVTEIRSDVVAEFTGEKPE